MSLHEMGESVSKAKYYPDALDPVAKQPGVDWANRPRHEDWRQWVDRKTGATRVEQTIDGGTWIQSKRLKVSAETSVDQRVISNIDDAMEKLDKPIRNRTSSATRTMDDGTMVTTRLTNPESFLVHLEVPGFSQLEKASQVHLQAIADQNLNAWKSHYPDLPMKVVVVDVP
jgi:hypothetical protein